ncbi:MAG: peptidylprolyl isomerase [Planctomycetes bacterium]|nr:peptidylprolyl isomerase [Planctomycetota bacterium]
MKRIASSVFACALVFAACGTDKTTNSTPAGTPPTTKPATQPTAKPEVKPAEPTPNTPAKVDMDAAIKELMAKPEVPDASVEIQHVLISFKGAPRMPASVTRSKDEAKALAEKVYAEAVGGADFLTLVKQYTNDSAPGIYPITKAGRKGYVQGFGDVGFRLKVGEIGVAPWNATASPFGWHIIKRVK